MFFNLIIDLFFVFTKNVVTSAVKLIFNHVSLYRGHLIRAILIGIVISVAVTTLTWIGYFKSYQNPLTNLLHFITQKKASDVVLLFITEEEWRKKYDQPGFDIEKNVLVVEEGEEWAGGGTAWFREAFLQNDRNSRPDR